jgi:acyl carrier protein
MGSTSDISPRILQALADYLKRDVHTINPRQALREDLGLDSMATIELLFKIEETFDLAIPDEHLQRLVTVADVIAYVEERLPQHAPGTPAAAAATPSKPRKTAAKRIAKPAARRPSSRKPSKKKV